MSAIATLCPWRIARLAIAAPMPFAAPVTSMIFGARFPIATPVSRFYFANNGSYFDLKIVT
jgi:hypothetical protein